MLLLVVLNSCIKTSESAEEATITTLEKAIENKTGTQVDIPNTDKLEHNGGYINYKSASKTYLTSADKMQANVIIEKNNNGLGITIQLIGEAGKSFAATINHIPENFLLPLKGKFDVGNQYDGINPVGVIVFMNTTENGMKGSEIPFEGEIVLTKLTKEAVEFTLEGKGGDILDKESPSNWKSISGNGKFTHPIIMTYGIDKNKILK